MEFAVQTIVSIAAVFLILLFIFRFRDPNPIKKIRNLVFIAILEIVCMLLGKFGANWGLPWWIYYPVPMFLTVLFPPVYFKMTKIETIKYLALIIISAPLIHIIFSLFGWPNYMPFFNI